MTTDPEQARRDLAQIWKQVADTITAILEAAWRQLEPGLKALAPLLAAYERQQRRAIISRRWNDPQARWTMWNRKTDRTNPMWRRTP